MPERAAARASAGRAFAALLLAAIVAVVAVVASLPVRAAPASAPAATVFDSYRTALAGRKTPVAMEFEYTVTRSGPTLIRTEQHRVYWTAAGLERNDTIAVNATPLVPARTRLLRRTAWPYDVGQFAVSTDDYAIVPGGATVVAGRKAYAFALTRNAQADFMLTALYLDASTRLPLRQTFAVSGVDCQGSGRIDFSPFGGYWLPSFVSVVCTGAPQAASPPAVFKEAIRFSAYSFPVTIPPDVFGQTPTPGSPTDTGPASSP